MAMKVKICGITNLVDALQAVSSGADLLGFMFYPKSPRYVTPETAAAIVAELPADIEKVGIFVDESNDAMCAIAGQAGLTTVQMHGHESPEQVAAMQAYPVVKAVALREHSDLAGLNEFEGCTLLVDTPSPDYGGTGKIGNWELAAAAAETHQIFLAGGLNADNVAAAIAAVHPYGVDVSSGVERKKGLKDHNRVAAFVANARGES